MILPLIFTAAFIASPAEAEPCAAGDPKLITDFAGASDGACVRTGNHFTLTISPEATPINKSPWFAFDIVAEAPASVEVTLDYSYGTHRYVPKRQTAAGEWSPLAAEDIAVAEDGTSTTLWLDVTAGRMRIAGQPVIPAAERRAWAKGIADAAGFGFEETATSPDGHPIPRLTSLPAGRSDETRPLIVLLGSQHPPEVPGWLAMMAFVERLAEDDPLATSFRDKFRIEMFPVLNPDGVDRGHWRMNTAPMDINRDWGPFTQSETRYVEETVADVAANGHAPILMIDFHATFKGDILYTPTPESISTLPDFPVDWAAAIDQQMDGNGFEAVDGHNPDLPTAKSWFAVTYGAPGITLEIGDETPPDHIHDLGVAAAETMMTELVRQYPD